MSYGLLKPNPLVPPRFIVDGSSWISGHFQASRFSYTTRKVKLNGQQAMFYEYDKVFCLASLAI
jgi:hypothetical protein